MENKKTLSTVFRLLLIVVAVVAVMNMATFIYVGINERDMDIDDECEMMAKMVKYYNFTTFGSLILLVLSVLSTSFCHKISNVFRTIMLLGCTIFSFVGFHTNRVMGWVCTMYDELGSLLSGDYEDIGLDSDQYEEVLTFNFGGDETMIYILAVMIIGMAFFILALTSLHWLLKKKAPAQPENAAPVQPNM